MKTARVLLALGSWAAWLLAFALVFHSVRAPYHKLVAAGAQFVSASIVGANANVVVEPTSSELLFKVRAGGIEATYAATTTAMDAAGSIFLATVAATPVRGWRRRMAMFLLGCAVLVVGMVALATGFALIPMAERGFVLKSRTAWHAAELSRMIYHTGSIMVLPSAIWFLFTIPLWRLSLAGQSLETRDGGIRRAARDSRKERRRKHRDDSAGLPQPSRRGKNC